MWGKKKRNVLTWSDKREIKELRQEGYSYARIGRLIGRHRSIVYRFLKKEEKKLPKKKEEKKPLPKCYGTFKATSGLCMDCRHRESCSLTTI